MERSSSEHSPLEVFLGARTVLLDLVRLRKALADVAVAIPNATVVEGLAKRLRELETSPGKTMSAHLHTEEALLLTLLTRRP